MKRKELYDLVWSKPMIHAAKQFGISDVALRKICVKHNIPSPPLGYWANLAHGKAAEKPPLPPLTSQIRDDIHLTARPDIELPQEVLEAQDSARAREMHSPIAFLAKRPDKLHNATAATEKVLKAATSDREGFIQSKETDCVSVSIGRPSLGRAILLIETVLRACLERGLSVKEEESGVKIVCEEGSFEFRVYETKAKKPYVMTSADIKRQADYDANSKRIPVLYPPKKLSLPSWTYFPSGRLCLEVSDPSIYRWREAHIVGRWYDRSEKAVDQYISDVLVQIAGASALKKIRRRENEERERIRAEQEERRRRAEELRKQKEKRVSYFKKKAAELDDLRKLELLMQHLDGQDGVAALPVAVCEVLKELVIESQGRLASETIVREMNSLELLVPPT